MIETSQRGDMNTIEKLNDLIYQAGRERSHFDVAATCREAIRLIEMQDIVINTAKLEIQKLRIEVDRLGEYKSNIEGLC